MISVIVPVYNVEDYLEKCIESIIGQTYTDIEVILVNDGSTDGSGDICDKYSHMDKRIYVIHKENGGNTSARKEGIQHCHGDYIAFVDADDWLEPDMFQQMLALGSGADIMVFAAYEEYGGFRKVKDSSVAEGLYNGNKLSYLYENMMMNGKFYVHGIPTNLWGKLIKRRIISKVQLSIPDIITYGEDSACVYPCILNAESVYVSNLPLYHYRIRQGSIVHGSYIEMENFRYLYEVLKSYFDIHKQKIMLNRQLKYFMWQALLLKQYDKIGSHMVLFPFQKVKAGMKVAVYGAGLFGQMVRQYCMNSGIVSISGWFDKEHEMYNKQKSFVYAPEVALGVDFDVMVIAILNTTIAKQIKDWYIHLDIEAERIDYVSLEVLEQTDLPFCIENAREDGVCS
ncbi:MAG: glycosyltransferase [Lachnospiraceae bacterium]|nr:glycosyltransferase [Lachnospiraceae bacterium]